MSKLPYMSGGGGVPSSMALKTASSAGVRTAGCAASNLRARGKKGVCADVRGSYVCVCGCGCGCVCVGGVRGVHRGAHGERKRW